MPKTKVEWWKANGGLAEIYQSTHLQFAFLSAPKDGSKQCCAWSKCRDFLHDALRTKITGVKSSIYGFVYDVKTHPPIDLRRTRMLVKKSGVKKISLVTRAE